MLGLGQQHSVLMKDLVTQSFIHSLMDLLFPPHILNTHMHTLCHACIFVSILVQAYLYPTPTHVHLALFLPLTKLCYDWLNYHPMVVTVLQDGLLVDF